MNHYLVKSEPLKYSWEQFQKDKKTVWDGVRNYQARNTLMAMQKGEPVLFYHSNEGMEIVGIAEVSKTYFPDPTTDDSKWVAVELRPKVKLKKSVTLEQIKADPRLSQIGLVRQGRLSVMTLTREEFDCIIELSEL